MTSWGLLLFQATQTLLPMTVMTKAHFHVLFMKGCCVTNCFLDKGTDTLYVSEDVVEDGRNGWMVGIRK